MSSARSRRPTQQDLGGEPVWHLPDAGVVRLHRDPGALPPVSDAPGPNRFDDPRRGTRARYRVRYAATSLRGCLLESLDWLRVDPHAAAREAAVDTTGNDSPDPPAAPAWQAMQDYLGGRRVAVLTGPDLGLVSIDDTAVQAHLDREVGVRALLDSDEGRAALLPAGAPLSRRAHLDGAAVRLSTTWARALTQAASLALHDRPTPPDGIHYRSRHDDAEDCWALYDHAEVHISDPVLLSPLDPDHRAALRGVARLWDLPLPPTW